MKTLKPIQLKAIPIWLLFNALFLNSCDSIINAIDRWYDGAARADYNPNMDYGSYGYVQYGNVKPPSGAQSYGLGGTMNAQNLTSLTHLNFSQGQSYDAIKNKFGLPKYRTATADYYQIEGSNRWIAVYYGSDGRAIGYGLGDSQ